MGVRIYRLFDIPYNRIISLYKHFVLKDGSRAKELLTGLEVTEIKDVDDFVAKVIPHFPAKNPNHHLKSIVTFYVMKREK